MTCAKQFKLDTLFISLVLSIFCFSAKAGVSQSSFIVTVKEYSIRVVSPRDLQKKEKKISVVIENKTISKLIGKLVQGGIPIHYVSLAPNTFKTVEFDYKKNEKVEFIPLAPAFQEASLIIGQKTYEIPPQR